jgi:DNA-binding CsgD family transcriptional regulator
MKIPKLTSREFEVAMAVSRDLSNSEIARELKISVYTVGNHVSSIIAKLRLSSRAGIAREAVAADILSRLASTGESELKYIDSVNGD